MTEDIITNLLNEVDVNKDGLIDYNEFITMMKNNSEYSSSLLA
jgi:Ca2+-binding EF-hand superfamily protein